MIFILLCLAYFSLSISCASEFHSFLRLSHIPSCTCTTVCFFIHLSMHTWAASTFRLLWIMLQWVWVYKYSFETWLSILEGVHPILELVTVFTFLRHCHAVFHWLCHFPYPPAVHQCSNFSTFLLTLLFFFFFYHSHSTASEVIYYCVPGCIWFGYVGRPSVLYKNLI